jgi:hypothetical protein
MEPVELPDELRVELDAFGVDGEPPLVDAALPGNHIQVAAGGLGEIDGAVALFELFEAAEAAALAESFPGPAVIIVRRGCSHGSRILTLGRCVKRAADGW